jgi:hypothetical protein
MRLCGGRKRERERREKVCERRREEVVFAVRGRGRERGTSLSQNLFRKLNSENICRLHFISFIFIWKMFIKKYRERVFR